MASHSQHFTNALPHPQVLSLAKFSFATCSLELNVPINWTHLPDRDDLYAVFDNIRVQMSSNQIEEKSVLKVVRGSEIMEKLDLNSLAKEAKAEEALLTDPNTQAQSPVLVIVRSPCIAIRYPLPTRQSRRFQMRFKNEPDYYKALTVLSELGFPLKQATPVNTGAQPSSSMQTHPTSSVSTHTTKIKESESQVSHNIRDILAANGSAILTSTKPTSSSSSATIASTALSNYAPPTLQPSPFFHPTPSSTLRSRTNGHFPIPSTDSINTPASQSLEQFLQTETAPHSLTILTETQTTRQWMPPKRELPFSKPPPHPALKLSKPSPPLKKSPVLVRKQPARARKQTKKAYHVPTVEELLKMPTSGPATPKKRRSTVTKSKANPSISNESISNEVSTPATLAPSNCLNSLKRPFEGQGDLHQKRSRSLYNQDMAPSLASLHEGSNVHLAGPGAMSGRSHSHATPAARVDPWGGLEMDLSAFIARPPADRQREIEDWICQQLLDPDFKTICEDMELCWRSAFLGERQS